MFTKEQVKKIREEAREQAEKNPREFTETFIEHLDNVGNAFVMIYNKIEKLDARLTKLEKEG